MTTSRWVTLFGILTVVILGAYALYRVYESGAEEPDEMTSPDEQHRLSAEEERIVKIALTAISERAVQLPDKWDVQIARNGGEYVITWPFRYDTPAFGPEYHFQITIDSETEAVTRILAGD